MTTSYVCPHVDTLKWGNYSARYPPRWGPTFWKYLHMASIFYGDWDITITKCITSTVSVIPCDICKNHALEFLKNNEMGVQTIPPFKYINNLHNSVNSANGHRELDLNTSFKQTVSWLKLPDDVDEKPAEEDNEAEGSLLPVLALSALLGCTIAYGYSRSNVSRQKPLE